MRLRSSEVRPTFGPPRLLVVGCGGPLAADDNVGLEIVHRLQSCGGCGCRFLELAGGGLDLLYSFEKAEIILFVDAVQSGAPAGTVHLLPLPSREVVPRAMGRVSSHGWGLDETLRLAQSLGIASSPNDASGGGTGECHAWVAPHTRRRGRRWSGRRVFPRTSGRAS